MGRGPQRGGAPLLSSWPAGRGKAPVFGWRVPVFDARVRWEIARIWLAPHSTSWLYRDGDELLLQVDSSKVV